MSAPALETEFRPFVAAECGDHACCQRDIGEEGPVETTYGDGGSAEAGPAGQRGSYVEEDCADDFEGGVRSGNCEALADVGAAVVTGEDYRIWLS